MKFNRYLNEEDKSIEETLAILKKDCKPILNWMKKSDYDLFLYRWNSKKAGTIFELITPRKDRNPSDTPPWLQEIYDDAFEKKFGVRARSSGVFCQVRQLRNQSYSSGSFAVFPVGKFKYIWKPKMADLFVRWTEVRKEFRSGTGGVYNDYDINSVKAWATDIIDTYTDKNLDDVILEEVMLICDKYYLVSCMHMLSVMEKLEK